MSDNPLDNEVSISAKVTPDGVEARAKSRFVSAVDALAGDGLDWLRAHVEGDTKKRRARDAGEVSLIEAAAKYGVEKIAADPEFAQRALANGIRGALSKQANTDQVLREAVEDLRENPPSPAQNTNGPEEVSEPFLDKFGPYAAAASTSELRQKWGRVLASEIRKPGTFSTKVLRIVDEIDSKTAQLFERVAKNRVGDVIPKVTFGALSFDEMVALVDAGLLADTGLGVHKSLVLLALNNGKQVRFNVGENWAVAFPAEEAIKPLEGGAVEMVEGEPRIPCEVLTPAGQSIATILEDTEEAAVRALCVAISRQVSEAYVFTKNSDGTTMRIVDTVKAPSP